jgi:nucleotide-binding universal stress UspA family protein
VKTILAPVNFSTIEEGILEYAAELAKFSLAKLILFNVYSIPVSKPYIAMLSLEQIAKERLTKLKLISKILTHKHPGIKIELITCAGFIIEEILTIVEDRKIDLVIMGLRNKDKQGSIGRITSTIMQKAKCPILIIHPGTIFKKPEKIALAFDFSTKVPDNIVYSFKEFTKPFNPKILVFDVLKQTELITQQRAEAEINLESLLVGVNHSLYYPSGDNLPAEANNFVKEQNIDVLAVIPHNHNFFQSLFQHNVAKKIVFRSKVPILSIHE